MTADKIIVSIAGLIGIFLTYWYFFGKKEKIVEAKDSIDITVNGGYSPDVISLPQGKMTKINFTRRDPSTCLEEVVLSDFKIRKFLPLNQKVTIEVTPEKLGTFPFSCGMNMFHGKIIVK